MQKEIEQIELDLKEKWLNHELDLAELAVKAQKLVRETKEKNPKFENWREYLRVKCLVDEKVKNTEAVFISVASLFVSTLSCFFSVSSDNTQLWYVVGIGFVCILILLGTILIGLGVKKSYSKNYPRERAFYELLLRYADEASKSSVTKNVNVESSNVSVSVKQGDFSQQEGTKHLEVCVIDMSETNEGISEEITVNVSKENVNVEISCNRKED